MNIISFKDFFRDLSKRERLGDAVSRMNNYLKDNEVKVLAVETITSGGGSNVDQVDSAMIGVRLWMIGIADVNFNV